MQQIRWYFSLKILGPFLLSCVTSGWKLGCFGVSLSKFGRFIRLTSLLLTYFSAYLLYLTFKKLKKRNKLGQYRLNNLSNTCDPRWTYYFFTFFSISKLAAIETHSAIHLNYKLSIFSLLEVFCKLSATLSISEAILPSSFSTLICWLSLDGGVVSFKAFKSDGISSYSLHSSS